MAQTEIGVMAHNEAGNLGHLLARLLDEPGDHRICVVSSGSTDGTDRIAMRWAEQQPRIRVILEPTRRGKARAINRFFGDLAASTERVVLVSGDVLPERGSLERLLAPLDQTHVQMTGAHPCPDNPRDTWIGRVVHFQWALLDQIARDKPKLGEMVALRTPIHPIDPESVVDEAALEAQLTQDSASLAYVSDARVTNRGPGTWGDLLAQRERIWIGHRRLFKRTGYRVSTHQLRDLVIPTLRFLIRNPGEIFIALTAAAIELLARTRGSLRNDVPTIWPTLHSAKVRP
jgi:cellulose synthase/poly-beta-1,6-N-acetylglucosamine synthase-like glycosyltransferase